MKDSFIDLSINLIVVSLLLVSNQNALTILIAKVEPILPAPLLWTHLLMSSDDMCERHSQWKTNKRAYFPPPVFE